MVTYSHDEIPAIAPTTSNYDVVKDAVRQARNAVCKLRASSPERAIRGEFPQAPAAQWLDATWDNICRNSPTPTVPRPRRMFNGGQCPVNYNVVFTFTVYYRSNNSVFFSSGGSAIIKGALGGTKVYVATDGTAGIGIVDGDGVLRPLTSGFDVNSYRVGDFAFTSVTRVDGLPDNCGDPEYQYPPTGDPPLTPGDKTIIYDPPSTDRPGGGWSITVPVVLIRGEANLNVDAKATVNIDVGGINLNFDAGGIEVNIGRDGGGGGDVDLTEVTNLATQARDAANEAKDAANSANQNAEKANKALDDRNNNRPDDPQNDPNKQEKEQKQEDDPKEEDAVPRLLAVEVELLDVPKNVRTQDGGDAPDVVYAGWFEFKTKGTPHPRQPIHFGRNYYIAPAGADGYAYTVYNGITARATVIKAKATP